MMRRLPRWSARTRSLAAVTVGALGWAAVVACNQQTINTPIRSFDRPSDAALVCLQYNPNQYDPVSAPHGVFNTRPLADCEPTRAASLGITPDPKLYAGLPAGYIPPVGPGTYSPFLMAVVTQSARGEVAFVDTAQERLVDLDPYKPGFGFIPVGKLPEHVRATNDGCLAVTANTDSCDLSRVDVLSVMKNAEASLFASDMGAPSSSTATGVATLPLTVRAGDGSLRVLHARPTWVELAPENDGGAKPSLTGATGGPPGVCTPQAGTAHKAWVALPACQAVVKVRLEADGKTEPTIEQAIKVTKSGAQEITDLSTLDCPVECAGVPSDLGTPSLSPSADMAGVDGGSNLPTSQAWPAALAVDVEGDVSGPAQAGRLIIGDGYGERVDIVPFDVASAKLGTARSVTLDPGSSGLSSPGVRVLRTGRRTEAGKFLYAVARDGTVRVVDLDRAAECETNPDPRFSSGDLNLQQVGTPTSPLPSPQAVARKLGCFPLGAPGTPPRSPLATSPGISLTPGQIPVDVAFVHLDVPPGDATGTSAPPSAGPGLLVGDFAWIITSDGRGTVINIYDACPAPNQQPENQTSGPYTPACVAGNVPQSLADTVLHFGHPQPMLLDLVSHRLRAGHGRFVKPLNESDTTGTPRVTDHLNPCAVAVPATSAGIPDGGVDGGSGCNGSPSLPSLYHEPVPPELQGSTPTGEERVVRFTDPDRVRNETWVMRWEGVIPGTDRALGQPFVVAKAGAPNGDAYVADPGGAWCSRGVLAGDKLFLRGCTVDTECDQAAGFTCVHDPGAFSDVTQGMCLPTDPKLSPLAHTAEEWPSLCGTMLRTQRKYRILSAQQGVSVPGSGSDAKTDALRIAEIYEPEYPEERTPQTGMGAADRCTSDADCASVTVPAQVGGSILRTSCLADVDGAHRCLLKCDIDPMTTLPNDKLCGVDFECAPSQMGDLRCLRAPVDKALWAQCMPEAQQYEIHVGDAFSVSGSSSGFAASLTRDDVTGECIVPPQSSEYVRLRQWRIPLTPAKQCKGGPLDTINPNELTNVCSIDMGNRIVHFENPTFNIAMQLPLAGGRPIIPPDGTAVSMTLTGGGAPLLALLGVDVEAQQPRSVVVAPDGQTVYIVDEGKASTAFGLRGQLLRLFSPSQSVDTTFVVR